MAIKINPQYQIAEAQESDISQLVALYKECRRYSDVGELEEYFRAIPDDWYQETWKTSFLSPNLYRAKVLWDAEKPIGFCRVGPLDSHYMPLLAGVDLPQHCGELKQIYLLPDYQEFGLGGLLYQEACRDLAALGYEKFVICSYMENPGARGFYERMGATLSKNAILMNTYAHRLWHIPVSFFTQTTQEIPQNPLRRQFDLLKPRS